jgi:hypothetical protein
MTEIVPSVVLTGLIQYQTGFNQMVLDLTFKRKKIVSNDNKSSQVGNISVRFRSVPLSANQVLLRYYLEQQDLFIEL